MRHQNIAVVINLTTITGSRLSPVFVHTKFVGHVGAGEGDSKDVVCGKICKTYLVCFRIYVIFLQLQYMLCIGLWLA